MILGLDFDNTIVNYDRVFHSMAVERGLIPPDIPPAKDHVRNFLRRIGKEDRWTELQGIVYGPGMEKAEPFAGSIEFISQYVRSGRELRIISHRTRFPFLGEAHDLHAAAMGWLERHGVIASSDTGLDPRRVLLAETAEGKLKHINAERCTHFVDDLPEFLTHPSFPAQVHRVLFDPHSQYTQTLPFDRMTSWRELETLLSPRS